MSYELWFCSTQHSVGQGLMHSGVVYNGGSWWPWDIPLLTTVYDCGTSFGREIDKRNRIKREVSALRRRSDVLDALYISHFDTDHVYGLPILLDEFTPRVIVIPATSAAERLLRLVHAHGVLGVADLDETTLRILVDPVQGITALLEGSETEIVEVSPEEGDSFVEASIPQNQGEGDTPDVVIPSASTKGVGAVWANGKLIWIVKPWVQQSVKEASTTFLSKLNVKDDDELKEQLPTWLKCIHKERKRIEAAYKQAVPEGMNRSLNLTSLCLYSGPPSTANFIASTISQVPWLDGFQCLPTHVQHMGPGWFGTGDAPFGKEPYLAGFENHYRDVLRFAGQITVPHHGSRTDTPDEFVDLFRPGATWIASAGLTNSFKHPNTETVDRILGKGGSFVHVSEKSYTRFTSINEVTFS